MEEKSQSLLADGEEPSTVFVGEVAPFVSQKNLVRPIPCHVGTQTTIPNFKSPPPLPPSDLQLTRQGPQIGKSPPCSLPSGTQLRVENDHRRIMLKIVLFF